MNFKNYDLGIIWAIGSQVEENRFSFRHKEKYFLDRIRPYFKNNVYKQQSKSGDQYVLKISNFDIDLLLNIGWTSRNSEARGLPMLSDYKDFLRAYIEVHSTLDYSTRHNRNGRKYKALRLRVYGNHQVIEGINDLLCKNAGVGLKTPQLLKNGKTSILYYQNPVEIHELFDYLYGAPYYSDFWDEVNQKLKRPTNMSEGENNGKNKTKHHDQ